MESSKVIVVQVVAMTNNTALHRFRIFVVCFIDPDILIDVISDDGMGWNAEIGFLLVVRLHSGRK